MVSGPGALSASRRLASIARSNGAEGLILPLGGDRFFVALAWSRAGRFVLRRLGLFAGILRFLVSFLVLFGLFALLLGTRSHDLIAAAVMALFLALVFIGGPYFDR